MCRFERRRTATTARVNSAGDGPESTAEVVEAAADCAFDLVELTGGSCFEVLPDCDLGDCHVIDCHVIDCHIVDCDPGCA
jgi:hypothetical protein